FYVADAMRVGLTDAQITEATGIDPWFLAHMRNIVDAEKRITAGALDATSLRAYKRLGFSDAQIASVSPDKKLDEDAVRALRKAAKVVPVYGRVDTCAAEFVAYTPYLYSTYESETESGATDQKRKVVILGGGPNRIGQGIEFDYCCVHAVQ